MWFHNAAIVIYLFQPLLSIQASPLFIYIASTLFKPVLKQVDILKNYKTF